MAKGKVPPQLAKFTKTSAQMARMGKGGSKAKPVKAAAAKKTKKKS